ncbi:MAG: exosortase A, partial [Burkholderiales bacterium]
MASLTASSSLTHAWRAAALRLLAIALVLAIGFHETWAAMFQVWMQSETYGHGLVVAPISAWLLWRIRDRWLAVTPGMSWWGLPLVVLGSAGWLVAELAKVNVAAQYGLLMILWGLTWTALGSAVVRLMLFPLAFLFFMVPAGDSLNAPLMEATATATIAALRAVGLPVYREGMLFTLPTGSWSVVEACSGLRYVLAAAMLGALFSYLNFRSWRLRVSFFVAAIVLALVGNWARAWLVVMIGHLSEMRYGTGEDHVWYGWAFFGVVMGGLFWMGGRWKDPTASALPAPNESLGLQGVPILARPSAAVLAIAAVLVALVPALERQLTRVTPREGLRIKIESAVGPLESGDLLAPPQIEGAREIVSGRLKVDVTDSTDLMEFTTAYFAAQSEGREMIAWSNSPVPDRRSHRWSVVSAKSLDSQETGLSHGVQERLLAIGQERRLMWSWYDIGGRQASSDPGGKLLTALALARGRGDHSCWQIVSMAVDVAGT